MPLIKSLKCVTLLSLLIAACGGQMNMNAFKSKRVTRTYDLNLIAPTSLIAFNLNPIVHKDTLGGMLDHYS